jgi:hypothetical protein
VSVPTDCEPLSAFPPDQPSDAEQEVAFAEVQVKVDSSPERIVLGAALMLTVGAADVTDTVADCVAPCPNPAHVSV